MRQHFSAQNPAGNRLIRIMACMTMALPSCISKSPGLLPTKHPPQGHWNHHRK